MSRAKILDYTALVNLKDSLKRFSECFQEPLNAIESELHDILQMMKEKLDVLYEEKERAKERLERAERARYRCESSQKWNEEDQCYHPSCDLERAAERMARAKYDEACKRYEAAEKIYKEVDYEVSLYLKPFGVIQVGGAADYLQSQENYLLTGADDKMEKILDIVEQILGSRMSPEGVDLSQSDVREKLIQEAQDKKGKFTIANREVSARIDQEEKDDVYDVDINDDDSRKKVINEFNSNKCPRCGRPKKICICGRDPLERER